MPFRPIALLALVLTAGVVVGCGSDKKAVDAGSGSGTTAKASNDPYGSSSGSETTVAGGAAATDTLTISGFAFTGIAAKAGATVKIVNKDGTEHTVTADDKSFDVDVPGASATLTAPSKAGSYKFHCKIHSTMHGTLTIS